MKGDALYDVVIVGFGPAGAVAACWLGQAGVKTLVIEKSRTIWDIPRAIALDHEILRVFQNIGIIDRVLPHTAPFGASEHYGVKGQLIRRIDVVPPPHPLGYLPNMVFAQPPVEAVLRDHAAAHPSVTIKLGHELLSLTQGQEGVFLTTKDDEGQIHSVQTRLVISCDGASSTVRRLLNIALEDLGFDEPWLVVDVLVNDGALRKLPSVCAQYCDPARPCTNIIGPGNHRRWELMLNPGEDPRQVEQEENVWRLLSRWLEPRDGRLWRASSYRFHALVAQRWRNGRVFLAGDAAHQQPPFIGQGMCQGVRDVTNLSWKIISVLRAESRESLLDTYEVERRQHVTTLTQRIKKIGAAICMRDSDSARLRDEDLLHQGGGSAFVVTRQEIVPPLEAGLMRESSIGAGTIFPQPWIVSPGGARRMDDLAGLGWRFIVDGRTKQDYPVLDAANIKPIVIGPGHHSEAEGVAASWFDLHGCKAALVRPDHYVYCGFPDSRMAREAWSQLQAEIGVRPPGPEFR